MRSEGGLSSAGKKVRSKLAYRQSLVNFLQEVPV
jgi:hypothetical protein